MLQFFTWYGCQLRISPSISIAYRKWSISALSWAKVGQITASEASHKDDVNAFALFASWRRQMTAASGQLDKPPFNLGKQGRRKRTIVARVIIERPDIRPRPNETIAFAQHDPGSLVVEPKTSLRSRWKFDRRSGVGRRRMGDRQNTNGRCAVFPHCDDGQHQRRTILVALFPPFQMLPMPQIGVAENPTYFWFSRQHACPSAARR